MGPRLFTDDTHSIKLEECQSVIETDSCDRCYAALDVMNMGSISVFMRLVLVISPVSLFLYGLCGLVVRVPGYRTEMYGVSCEV
jgi:hypothetical protein